ncbi:hypothetical protein GQ457_02G026050 [Hibiscus cannabinus]
MYVLLELVIDKSKCECFHVYKINYWEKYWNILSWSKLSEGANESFFENKVSKSARLITAAFDEILSDFDDVVVHPPRRTSH